MLHDTQWFGNFGMQWTLFSGLDTKAQVAQTRLRVNQLQEQRKDLDEQVRLDVQNAYLKVKETADRIRVTEKAVTQGEENLRLNEERYKEAVGTAPTSSTPRPCLPGPGQLLDRALRPPDGQAELLWPWGPSTRCSPRRRPPDVP